VRVGLGPKDGVVDSRGLVWVPNLNGNSVSIVDAATAALVSTIRVGETPFVLNDAFGDIWSGSYGAGDVRRLRAPRIMTAALTEQNASGQSGTARLIAVSRTKTLVAAPISKLANGRYALDVHRAAGDSSYVACSNLP
jgi:YVTN family beta-propeller protein